MRACRRRRSRRAGDHVVRAREDRDDGGEASSSSATCGCSAMPDSAGDAAAARRCRRPCGVGDVAGRLMRPARRARARDVRRTPRVRSRRRSSCGCLRAPAPRACARSSTLMAARQPCCSARLERGTDRRGCSRFRCRVGPSSATSVDLADAWRYARGSRRRSRQTHWPAVSGRRRGGRHMRGSCQPSERAPGADTHGRTPRAGQSGGVLADRSDPLEARAARATREAEASGGALRSPSSRGRPRC